MIGETDKLPSTIGSESFETRQKKMFLAVTCASVFGIIFILAVLHFFTHYSRAGILLGKIPGPRHYPIIGNSLDLLVAPGALWSVFRRCADEYYSVYILWACHWPIVGIRHPDDVEILLSSQKHIDKSLFYDFIYPWLKTGLLTSTGEKWRTRRKILTPAFHFNMLQEFVDALVDNSQHMVDSLKDEGGEIVKDLAPFLSKFTLNAICETAMGTKLRKEDSLQNKYRKGVRYMGDMLYLRAVRPWLKNEWIFSLTKHGRDQSKALKVLHYFTSKIIRERKEYHEQTGGEQLKQFSSQNAAPSESKTRSPYTTREKKRLAMLDLLIAVQKQHDNIDDLGIREEVDTFVFEGHDTTNMGMCFAILLLAEHKEIQARAREEVDAVFRGTDGKLRMNELQNMPYLERCIKESLRLFPAVPTISRRLNEDIQLTDYLIPRGSIVNCYIFDVHRDPNFWPEPLVYDPDRFLPERIRDRHPFSYVPFSGGPRNCIGQKFAMLELKAAVAYTLHNFYLEPMIECRNIPMLPDLVLKSAVPLDVKFVPIQR